MKRVEVLGVNVDCVSKAKLLEIVRQWITNGEMRTITYVNAHCMNIASANSTYRGLLNQADLVYSDGAGVVWASRVLDGCKLQKITGREWINDFCELAADQGLRLYILAGAPGISERARHRLMARWPTLHIVGVCDGFFQARSESQVLTEIQQTTPDVLLVGMGTPRQEEWIASHRRELPVKVCWAVGALFDYVAGAEPSVPTWMNALALEWLWRLSMDPFGKWQRYVIGNPSFALRVLWQKVRRHSIQILFS